MPPLFRRNLLQIVTYILQKAFFKRTLVNKKSKEEEKETYEHKKRKETDKAHRAEIK